MPIRINKQVLIGSAATLALAIAFSGCVPTEPPPPPENTLYFVPATGASANNSIQRWNPDTSELTTVASSSMNVDVTSVQPHGSTLLYVTWLAAADFQTGGFFTTNPDNKAQGVHRIATLYGVSVDTPSWSPDGSHLAVVENGTLYISTPTGGRTALGPGDYRRMWSPDGKKIAYMSLSEFSSSDLRVYDLSTGQNHLLLRANTPPLDFRELKAWQADNRHLVVETRDTAANDVVLAVFDAEAADPSAYTEVMRRAALDPPQGEVQALLSPAGDRAVYETLHYVTSAMSCSLVFFDGRADVALGGCPSFNGWSHDGAYLAFTQRKDDGSADAVVANRDGEVETTYPLPAPAPDAKTIWMTSWAKDANSLAMSWGSEHGHVDVLALHLPSTQWITAYSGDGGYLLSQAWSPNGQYYAFKPIDASAAYFYDRRNAGSAAQPLDANYRIHDWAANSKHLALGLPAPNFLYPSVLSITASGYSITQVPVIAKTPFVWSVPNF